MIKKGWILSLFVLSLIHQGLAIRKHTFPGLNNPEQFTLDHQYIYVSDTGNPENKIFIYDRSDFKLVKALLKKGEGPQEVMFNPTVAIDPQKLDIFANNKIIFYSKKFEYMSEIKLPFKESLIVPVGNNFVVLRPEREGNLMSEVYSLYNIRENNFVKIKDLVKIPVDMVELEKYLIVFETKIAGWKDRVFISTRKDFHIDVFDEQGNTLYGFDIKMEPIKSREDHREKEIEGLIAQYGKRLYEAALKERFSKKQLPEFLPWIKNINAGENRLYIQTYDFQDGKDKYVVLDHKGNIIDTRWLPTAIGGNRCFFDNKFFYFQENANSNGWELYMEELE